MTDTLRDLLVNLTAAGVAFCVGLFWRRIAFGFRTRRFRAFWRPLVADGSRIAVGLGDLEAFAQLREQLHRIGIRDFDLRSSQNVSGVQLRENLVLIGGPQSNQISQRALEQIPATFGFGVAETEFGDQAAVYDHHLGAAITCRIGESGEAVADQGIIIRCANPFDSGKSMLLNAILQVAIVVAIGLGSTLTLAAPADVASSTRSSTR
jgi:hypothetical protein